MPGTIAYFLGLVGAQGIKTYLQLATIGGGFATITAMRFYDERKAKQLEKKHKQNQEIEIEKKAIANKDWSAEKEVAKVEIEQKHNDVMLNQKGKVVEAANLVNIKADKKEYKAIKVPNMKALLLGHDKDGEPIWGLETNYIFAGTTRRGKTRKMHVLLLNFLANKQGDVYLVDLKGTDYTLYDGIPAIKCRITSIENVMQAVKGFMAEYTRRQQLINDGYTDKNGVLRPYLDIEDYNTLNPDNPLKDFMLFVDEFADISDVYTKNERPIGCYAEIIEMARKCAAMGGRVVMGTQRPSKDVIIGTLKNNCNLIGMGCLNETNSRIVIDAPGCEDLAKTEALGYVDTKLTKIFAYDITNEKLIACTDKLKEVKKEG